MEQDFQLGKEKDVNGGDISRYMKGIRRSTLIQSPKNI